MRIINKEVTETVQNTRLATSETITSKIESREHRHLTVLTVLKDESDITLGNKSYSIMDENYDLLMSTSPSFAPNKPLNDYREVDLWYVIDLIENS